MAVKLASTMARLDAVAGTHPTSGRAEGLRCGRVLRSP